MTKFELARTAGRWRPRSRTYVALAILFVTACSTNAKELTLPTVNHLLPDDWISANLQRVQQRIGRDALGAAVDRARDAAEDAVPLIRFEHVAGPFVGTVRFASGSPTTSMVDGGRAGPPSDVAVYRTRGQYANGQHATRENPGDGRGDWSFWDVPLIARVSEKSVGGAGASSAASVTRSPCRRALAADQ